MKKLNLITKEIKTFDGIIDIREEDIDTEFLNRINKQALVDATNHMMSIRGTGEFEGKAIYLSDDCDYALGKDSLGLKIFVPLKKK